MSSKQLLVKLKRLRVENGGVNPPRGSMGSISVCEQLRLNSLATQALANDAVQFLVEFPERCHSSLQDPRKKLGA